jgi:LuxR family transcriptional regulator, maltose regulon positive regulatory protein
MTNSLPAPSTSYWFPRTKLVPPGLTEDLYFRPELAASLRNAIRSRRVTLIAAPAGSGKTTLLAHLSKVEPQFSLAWITLDAEDNDPVAFLQLVILSLQEIFPGFGETILSLLGGRSHAGLNMRRVTAAIINELLDRNPTPFGLVLDDLHLLDDPVIFQCVDSLIEHLPPCMHLLIATATSRQSPLPGCGCAAIWRSST